MPDGKKDSLDILTAMAQPVLGLKSQKALVGHAAITSAFHPATARFRT